MTFPAAQGRNDADDKGMLIQLKLVAYLLLIFRFEIIEINPGSY